jgi:endonuclease/exonuclease/phosphatase family metal-dependent hydrolase
MTNRRPAISWLMLLAIWCGGFASPAVAEWRQTRTLAAPEAVQAAAADERFVYAIANTQVARYDRETGRRLAVSTGAATHLNSGFLWQGRLYCAHSNYPQTPELSEIKALDLDTLELADFKVFGNYGGSLTWAVLRDGHWWCNFARYGEHNAETFLVKFDAEWREQGRWTYPVEVIRQLGRNSLSGGIWQENLLLVTGHDDPVVFRLRLPPTGTVLEVVDTQPVPFTGQGFAADPHTGGLVGIHRARRQVVFAATSAAGPLRLRVLSYNIHHGEGVDGKLDLDRIARVIRSVDPDVVALQEVDRAVPRSQSVDQPAELARRTKMNVVFGANIPLNGGEYGNAVLSRWAIAGHKNHPLPNFDRGEQRGVLKVDMSLPDGRPPFSFLATHLDHRSHDRERVTSAQAIRELIAKTPDRPALLVGDLNDVPESATLAEFAKSWTRSNAQPLPTIPVGQPARQIDYLLFRPASRWKVIETKVLDEAVASDHRAILAVLEWLPE